MGPGHAPFEAGAFVAPGADGQSGGFRAARPDPRPGRRAQLVSGRFTPSPEGRGCFRCARGVKNVVRR